MPAATAERDHYGRMVCYFLAEGLRTRKISLPRAAEISEKVLAHVNLLHQESDFLSFVMELSKDFEELVDLGDKMVEQRTLGERLKMEQQVREFAIMTIPTKPDLALTVLQAASQEGATREMLCSKFPEFKEFVK